MFHNIFITQNSFLNLIIHNLLNSKTKKLSALPHWFYFLPELSRYGLENRDLSHLAKLAVISSLGT